VPQGLGPDDLIESYTDRAGSWLEAPRDQHAAISAVCTTGITQLTARFAYDGMCPL
jgi:hypothetical protein